MAIRIVIVGGGSSGWMTASYLAKALKTSASITVVQSSSIGTIGVGEATFSTAKLFFDFLGLREMDWMPQCSATYKLAIRFVDWTQQKGHFYHPFQRLETACSVDAANWWLKLKRGVEPFDYACFTVPVLCNAMRSPRHLDGSVYDKKVAEYFPASDLLTSNVSNALVEIPNTFISGHEVQYPYGYHLNAAELATFLQKYSFARGVSLVDDEVLEVPLKENGFIEAVRTRNHGLIEGDIFIDCTGFRGLLINQVLGEPFISFNESLLNDRAIAIQVPRDIANMGIRPYTTAHALNAGWTWNIPLFGRDGNGYVYSSSFLSEDDAESEFRKFLGPDSDNCSASYIKMRIGRSRKSWVKNCVAVGLSSGFVEPLESTGIFFIQHGIEEFLSHFPSNAIPDENMIESYNKSVAKCFDGIREFLTLHYFATDRMDTPFWRATKDVYLPDELRERLQIWKARLPDARNIYAPFHGFEAYSWTSVLLGLNYLPTSYLPILDGLDEAKAHAMFRSIKERSTYLVESLPSHYDYLMYLHNQ